MTPADLVAAMTEDELAEYNAALDAEAADRIAHPLACATLWHNDEPGHTSQLRNTRERLAEAALYRFTLGGNRSGKSAEGAMCDWLYALGADHPDVIRFLARNQITDHDIPDGPGTVVSCAIDSNDSREYLRPSLAEYAPEGCKWRNRYGNGVAEVVAPGGGKIIFKSVDQGRDGHQGTAVRRYRFDEEPPDRSVVDEAKMRIVDFRGHIAFTMTPLDGWTALLEEYLRVPDDDTFVRWLHGRDNPYIPADMLEKVLRKGGAHVRRARAFGEITALEGRIYNDWRRDLHVVKAFKPPEDWPRVDGIDFGTRNPQAIGWFALDTKDSVLHLYREHYAREKPQEWHIKRYVALSGKDHEPEWFIADPADTASRMTWLQHEIVTTPAYKGKGSVRAGIDAVAELLAPDAEGRVHLVVHDCCPNFIREIESYVWDTRKSKGDLPDKPLKKNDHLLDLTRYVAHHLQRVGAWDLYAEDEAA